MRTNTRIVLIKPDVERLRAILGARSGSLRDRAHLLDLQDELERASVVGADEIAADVVTLQSEVRVRDIETGVLREYTLVSPSQANLASGHISVLAPLGTALLGYREGDEVEWQMPGGLRRLQIEKVMQPPHTPPRRRRDPAGPHSHSPIAA
jgi:regulator of nucleoside diphosphate kinase